MTTVAGMGDRIRFMDRAHEISRVEALEHGLTQQEAEALIAGGDWRRHESSDYLVRTEQGLDTWWRREVIENGGSPDYERPASPACRAGAARRGRARVPAAPAEATPTPTVSDE